MSRQQSLNKVNSAAELESLRRHILGGRDASRPWVAICGGTGCLASGGQEVLDALQAAIADKALTPRVDVRLTGCHGLCERGPLLVVYPQKIFYQRVKPTDVDEIVAHVTGAGGVVDRLLYEDPVTLEKILHEDEVPFYKSQLRLVFGNNGLIDPTSIQDYLGINGYSAFVKALFDLTPREIVTEITESGLRGRGGGGFRTGWKWESTLDAEGDVKYVICNADEGDPGAYMDRSIMEGNPHSVLEGMLIGARAIGACEGYVYIRTEYPLAVARLEHAIAQAREVGLLGRHILGSDFHFDIHIARGSGAFVCGESSALIASIEGQPGEPRAKHVHMSESGLWGKPTTLNNVETWANIPLIINRGAEWFASIGTEKSKGTKVFSLVGDVRNSGLVEVPMGITLGQIVNDIGGGVPEGRTLKALQTGGPSGGCIPAALMELPVDFDSLEAAGSMMGSGGMIVMDNTACMVDVARYFVEFLVDESCGKCSSCREGLKHLHAVLNRICQGQGRAGDLELLEDLCAVIGSASLCGLGTSAPNPVLSTLKYFRHEYVAHIQDKKCPAKVCRPLLTYEIIAEKCIGCGACRRKCPAEAIAGGKKEVHRVDQALCIKCGQCLEACKFAAVRVD